METIDIDKEFWESIKEAASKSPWIPKEYYMNDWVADVRAFLLQKPLNKAVEHEQATEEEIINFGVDFKMNTDFGEE